MTPFLPASSPLSARNAGDIEPGAQTEVISAFTFMDPVLGTVTLQAAAAEGLLVLTADGDFFSDDLCSQNAKTTFWNGLWMSVCDTDGDGALSIGCGGFDCDDTDPSVGASVEFLDLDGDGYGDPTSPAPCEPGAVADGSDCDDSDEDVRPGAEERCDGVDNDCVDGADVGVPDAATWHPDQDADGFGSTGDGVQACAAPEGHVADATDCDDTLASTSPGAIELCGNQRDDDCDGQSDEGCPVTVVIPPKDPCGCASGRGPGGAVALLCLMALGVRRRRARSPAPR